MIKRSALIVGLTWSLCGCGESPSLYGTGPDGGAGHDLAKSCPTPCTCADRGPPDYSGETAGKPTFNGDDSQHGALVRANHWRTAVGLTALDGNDMIEAAATAHARYNDFAQGQCLAASPHEEVKGCPGFTGVTGGDREMAAGYQFAAWSEVIFSSGADPSVAVDWWVFSVYHRLPFLNYGLLEMGAGHASEYVVDFGRPAGTLGQPPSAPLVFPPPGATRIPAAFDGNSEGPMPPPPPDTGTWPGGVPISVHFSAGNWTITEHHIYQSAACTEVPHAYFDAQTDANLKGFAPDTVFLYTNRPMLGGTEYVVKIVGTLDGKPWSRSWAFST